MLRKISVKTSVPSGVFIFSVCLILGVLCTVPVRSQSAEKPDGEINESRRKLNTKIQRLIARIGEKGDQLTPAEVVAATRLLRRSMRGEELTEPEKAWKGLIHELVDKRLNVAAYREAASKIPFTGLIEVESVPAGATIILDGRRTALVTPDTLSVSVGGYEVGVQLSPDYESPTSQTVQVGVYKPAKVNFRLTHVGYGTLLVGSRPFGAAIYLDGKRTGDTPQKLNSVLVGQHLLRLVLNKAAYTETVTVHRDGVTKVIGVLEPTNR